MTNTYVLTLKLLPEKWQKDILNKRLEIGRNMYNALLGEILNRERKMKKDPRWHKAYKTPKGKERNKLYKELNTDYGVTEYSLYKHATPMNRQFKKNIPAKAGIKIAKRAWESFDRKRFGDAKKVRFKRKGEFLSLEGSDDSGIMIRKRFFKMKGLTIPVLYENTEYEVRALEDRVKYARLMKRVIKGQDVFFVQLMLEGIPPKKSIRPKRKTGSVGVDIGTSSIAVVSDTEVFLDPLSKEIETMDAKKRVLQRKIDRQRRANNPHKFNEDGTIKKGNKEPWIISKNMQKTQTELKEVHRLLTRKRKLNHQAIANKIVAMGIDIKVETMNFKGLQKRAKETTINQKTGKINKKKRFGKSLGVHAPAMLVELINQKSAYDGYPVSKINTWNVKASQYDHVLDDYIKVSLSTRWKNVGGNKVQRDLYSAFLIQHVEPDLETLDKKALSSKFDNFVQHHNELFKQI